MLYNLLGPRISFYRKSKINVKREPNYEIGYNTDLGYRLKGEASKAVREGRCAGNCDCEQIQVELLIVLWMSCSLNNLQPNFYRNSERCKF